MKVICAWCGEHLRGDEKDTEISHGICVPCSEIIIGEGALSAATELLDLEENQVGPLRLVGSSLSVQSLSRKEYQSHASTPKETYSEGPFIYP